MRIFIKVKSKSFLVETILTEEGADEGVPKEQGIKSMSLKKDWDYFLEDDLFGLKAVFRLGSLLREVYFLDAIIFLGTKERA